jgi:hypothetical protein
MENAVFIFRAVASFVIGVKKPISNGLPEAACTTNNLNHQVKSNEHFTFSFSRCKIINCIQKNIREVQPRHLPRRQNFPPLNNNGLIRYLAAHLLFGLKYWAPGTRLDQVGCRDARVGGQEKDVEAC